MEIVVADGYAVNPGDLSWEEISSFGHLIVYDRTLESEIAERCGQADIILTNKVPLDRSTLEKSKNLKLICVLATGYNIVDILSARENNILVCNVPAYGTSSVAQHTIALILELTNQVGLHSTSVHNGEWHFPQDWSYAKSALIELEGKILGIVGFGNIGQQTAKIARALGMEVLYTGPADKQTKLGKFTGIEELFRLSDIVSLHCPLKKENLARVNHELIGLMKSSAFLINTARGQLIHEQDLAEALNAGRLAGAALDVLALEPPAMDNPLLKAKHCIITPHNAWKSREARERILKTTAMNIRAFLSGQPTNVVS